MQCPCCSYVRYEALSAYSACRQWSASVHARNMSLWVCVCVCRIQHGEVLHGVNFSSNEHRRSMAPRFRDLATCILCCTMQLAWNVVCDAPSTRLRLCHAVVCLKDTRWCDISVCARSCNHAHTGEMQDSLTVADVSKSGVSRHVLGLRKLRPVLLSHWTLSVQICSRGYWHNDKPVTLFAVKSAAFLPISSASNFCKKCAQVMPVLHAQKACSFQHGGPKGRDQHSGKRSHAADSSCLDIARYAKSQTCIYGDFREWEGGPGIHELCWNYHRNAFQFQPCRLLTRYLQARQAFLVLVLETIGAFAHCPCK